MIAEEQRSLKQYPALLAVIAGNANIRKEFEALLDDLVSDDLQEIKLIEVSNPAWSQNDLSGLVIKHARYERMSNLRDVLMESLKTE